MNNDELLENSIVLNSNSQSFIYKYIKNSNMRTMYKNVNNKILEKIFNIMLKYNLLGKSYFFNNWKKEIKDKSSVIIFDNGYKTAMTKYIRKKNRKCKIIVFCWNTLNEENCRIKDDNYIDEIYSFDLGDVGKYNLKFNNSFYTKDIILEKIENQWDLFFIGWNKNREKTINEIIKQCEIQNIKYNFKIIKDIKDYVKYDDYLQLLNKSKAVLDITKKGQRGITVRAMECLFLKKKLITDNKEIKKFDFYNRNNIFILGEDNIEEMRKFINTPFEDIKQEIIDKYDYKNWCLRMIKGDEQEYEI